jgi:F-type H+-transporting ATPase subunit delta
MKDRRLAVRYAKALLSVLDTAVARQADAFLTALRDAMETSAEFRGLLLDPAVAREARKSVLRTLAQQKGQPREMANFLATLVDHNRTGALPTIAEVFHEQLDEATGVVPAEMATAVPLSADLEQRARTSLEKLTGRRVQLTTRVDPDLIGGAVTTIGSMVYDGSVRTQLRRLRREMSRE